MSEPPRCKICDWPLKATIEEGCTADSCSYRPERGSEEYRRIQERREQLAARGRTGELTNA